MRKLIDRIGLKFDRLTIIEELESIKYKTKTERRFKCKCNCGNTTIVCYGNLVNGSIKSCGCLSKELLISRNKIIKVKHSECNTPTYISHKSMLARCDNPNNPDYKNYGGRGINYDESFKTYIGFRKYLIESGIGLRPSLEYSLDRYPDNDKGYIPGNIRWATMKIQQNNRRNNKRKSYGQEL